MKKFIAMRHGESEANLLRILTSDREKYPLTVQGIEQVENSVSQLLDVNLNGILCSPVLRTRQTAEIASRILGIPVEVEERLRETDVGPYEGKSVDNLFGLDRSSLGIESWSSHVSRMRSAVSSRDGSYLIVSHELPLRTLICSYIGIIDENACYGMKITYASMTAISCETNRLFTLGALHLSDSVKNQFNAL